jgi:predicted MFS family arabinose efflux permease
MMEETNITEVNEDENRRNSAPDDAQVSSSYFDRWSKPMRLRILLTYSCLTLLLPLTDTVYLPSLTIIVSDLHTTSTLVATTISIYAFALGLFPLMWGPLADFLGRKRTLSSPLWYIS